jgi:hypothetical protein
LEGEGIGPFALESLNEALGLAIRAWSIGFRSRVFDTELATELGEAIRDVARPVVAEDPFNADAAPSKPLHGTLQEGCRAGRPFVLQDLGVGQTRSIVDCDMNKLPADPATTLAVVSRDAMSNPLNAAEFLDI